MAAPSECDYTSSEDSASDVCSSSSCSCDSGSCCSSESADECSSCSCSPRSAGSNDEHYQDDLDQLKTFIADVASLIRQSRNTEDVPVTTNVEVQVSDEKPIETPVEQPVAAPFNKDLDNEIANFEQLINSTEIKLNGHSGFCEFEAQESPYATTVADTPVGYCFTNDDTAREEMPEESCSESEDEAEPDLDKLHSRLVALDLHSYMGLVESVLDKRVKLDLL
ncbi:hypothetical protein BBOV_II002130 [Babesia bovis T2Bo]|uniref:Uncharacterized protein n=1 Tax=Babesia bovis TaxID=5865 RepID=A7ATA8_BABBO|nr:hypothetical protein BBOV_II002130 [Babesia bovis T2Bo]EDO06169.1 hypothetical protein BBOV_II002130 [Babesia bovis T2Bo]|eukprot:XP_001609737.1 hypothetical protein [Babesia bovis T2Bo]